jgi:hypothetical protein
MRNEEDMFKIILISMLFVTAIFSDGNTQNIGEIVKFDDSEWIILSAQNLGQEIKSNNLILDDATTNGKFIIIQYSVKNLSKKGELIFETPVLVDSEGREFNEYDNQEFYLPASAKTLMGESLPPSIIKKFYAIYEVAQDSNDLKFRARSLSFNPEHKFVKITQVK